MLSKVKQVFFLRKVEKMLANYQITVKHFIPGRVRLASPYWEGQSKIVQRLMPELEREAKIRSVRHTKETGTILVEYDPSSNVQEEQIEQWIHTVHRIHNEVITEEVARL
ncbi:HMA2 domain-containing protein [Pontibacillus salicampi]|uniref:HMA2 domain-containing protein n=1 Tax=Pontibacillus salicampi TaxID=1449801 RepID=A0ABV6LQ71_9BACI